VSDTGGCGAMAMLRRVARYLPSLVLLLVLLAVIPGGYPQWLAGYLVLFILQGYVAWLLFCKAGQQFYAYSATMTVGAYTTVVLEHYGIDHLVMEVVAGGVVAGVVAVAFFLSTSRARGFYAGIASFLLAILIPTVIQATTSVTGGQNGITVNGLNFTWGSTRYFVFIVVVVAAVVALLVWLSDTRVGRIFTLIADNEVLTEAAGIRTFNFKLLAYAIGGVVSGIGGGLYLNYFGSISSGDITVFTSVMIFFMPILGSRRSLYGPIIGACFLVLVPELFTSVEQYMDILMGTAYLVVMLFMQDGIVAGVANIIGRVRGTRRGGVCGGEKGFPAGDS